MELISIFNTGGVTLALTAIWLVLSGWFGYQAYKAHNSGWNQQTTEGIKEGDEKIPYKKVPQFWGAVLVTLIYFIAMLFVASDYKGV